MDIFEQANARFDCREVALRVTTLNKSNQGPCPFCGGTDRFYVHKGGDRCGCRECGFQGDLIDLWAKVQNFSRVQAARHLAGASATSFQKPFEDFSSQRKAPVKTVQEWQSESWQREAIAIIEEAESRIKHEGYHDQFLWQSRRIGLTTAQRFRLGYDPEVFDPGTKTGRPAIVIPWLNQSGNVTAIKYRFIDDLAAQEKGRRFSQKKGSESTLFGLNACHGEPDSFPYRVVIAEGEFNAIAIAQVMGFSAEVLSVGSQGNSKGLAVALKHCEKFPGVNVMLWFDEEKQVREAFRTFPKGVGFMSPGGLDANDILKTYGAFKLKEIIEKACPTSVYNLARR